MSTKKSQKKNIMKHKSEHAEVKQTTGVDGNKLNSYENEGKICPRQTGGKVVEYVRLYCGGRR